MRVNPNLYEGRSQKTYLLCKNNKSKTLKDKNMQKSIFLRKCLEKSHTSFLLDVRPLLLDKDLF
jgi:hypothetical protein